MPIITTVLTKPCEQDLGFITRCFRFKVYTTGAGSQLSIPMLAEDLLIAGWMWCLDSE
jgi:hypothetical protein